MKRTLATAILAVTFVWCSVPIHFTKDGTPLNVANPQLIVIKHKDMW